MTTGNLLLRRESGILETAATVEKFDDAMYAHVRRIWASVAASRYARAESEFIVARDNGHPGCPHCDWLPEWGTQHGGGCPLNRYRPLPGGNLAASAEDRELVEVLREEVFALEARSNPASGELVLDAFVKISPEDLRKLAVDEETYRLLSALALGELTLGARNLLLNEGINEAWELLCFDAATSAVRYNAGNARIGVGNSATAAAATDTALLGASSAFQAMTSGFPTFGTAQKATWKASFGSGSGEFAWQEWTVDNGAARNKNLNRKVEPLGTKPAGVTWTLTVEITLS